MKKGISIASLGIVLIILSILTGIVVVNSKNYIEETKRTKFVTEYMLVETAVKRYYDDNGVYPIQKQNEVESSIVLVASADADETQFGDDFGDALVGISLKVIDISLLGYDDLTTGWGESQTDYYAISNEGEIYYIKGVRYNGKLYYKVSGELKQN